MKHPKFRNSRPRPVHTIQRVLGGLPLDSGVAARSEAVPAGLFRSLFHMVHLVLVGIRRSHLTRMAGALSYRTMFGLIPVIVVVAVALAAFTSQNTQQSVIRQMLVYAGLDRIRIDIPASPPGTREPPHFEGPGAGSTEPAPPPDDSVDRVVQSLPADSTASTIQGDGGTAQVVVDPPPALDEWINAKAVDIAGKIKQLPFNMIGLIAICTLIYAAVSMLVEIEQAFNDIYRAPEGRSWIRRIVQYWTLLTLGPVLLIASFTITHYLSSSAESLAEIGGETVKSTILSVLRFLFASGVSTVLLVVIYTTVPNTRVQAAPAFLGALVAGCLWELGKFGFTWYVEFATRPGPGTNYANLYGAVAILPLFLIWVYASWLIVLLGLQLAYSMQTYRQATARGLTRSVLATLGLIEDHTAGRARFVDPAGVVVVMSSIAERFRQGQSTDHNHVAERTGIDEQAVGQMLEKLEQAGLVHRVASGADSLACYALSRPPEKILATDVLGLGDALVGSQDPHLPRGPVPELVDRARYDVLAGKTIADLIPPPPEPEEPDARRPVPATPQASPA
ncbi:MAG: YhjD/YihY/BrkB family envelope integrity protein [Planctomycetota bacterium]|nr:YhjD/YihY/BrkB family envelope integrity protein [Planctomycetota bacterium]